MKHVKLLQVLNKNTDTQKNTIFRIHCLMTIIEKKSMNV